MEERKSRYELFLEEEERIAQPTKRCSKCKEVKALSEYPKDRSNANGIKSACKKCRPKRKRKYKDRADRFWKFYNARISVAGDCLSWTGGVSRGGVAKVRWNGKSTTVRRVLYQLLHGEISEGDVITMTCNHSWCVRQSHLEKATPEQIEMKRRNTASDTFARLTPTFTGADSHNAILTEDDVREIRKLRDNGCRQVDVADRFSVSPSTIQSVVRRKTWAHVQ
jgi:hypothetical protein